MVDLVERIKSSVLLFEQEDKISFNIIYNNIKKAEINADKEQLLRVFNNLIKNSIQAIPQQKEGHIELEISEEEKSYLISISDNGSGIAEEMQGKIFRPNFTTKSSGMGLGLSMVRNIIINIGGEIWFETEPNKGTSFYIRLLKHDDYS
jgi:signal transduction histidine kinase